MDVKTPTFLTQPHVFAHVPLEFPSLAQDPLQLQLAGLPSWTSVCNWIMTDRRDVFLPEHGVFSLLDLP